MIEMCLWDQSLSFPIQYCDLIIDCLSGTMMVTKGLAACEKKYYAYKSFTLMCYKDVGMVETKLCYTIILGR